MSVNGVASRFHPANVFADTGARSASRYSQSMTSRSALWYGSGAKKRP
jgi:hypothetical protein